MLTDWRPAPTHWPLASTDVQVWRVALDLPEERLVAFRSLLSADERARADRYHFAADARRYSVARGVLRRILSTLLSVAPEAVAFDYDAHGKPSLALHSGGSATLSFNVSHAGDCALIAVASGQAVGVDLERLRVIDQMDDLVRQHFTAREQRAFHALPVDQRQRAFFEVWTRKEAVLKALGVGLSREPATVEVWGGGQETDQIDLGDPAELTAWTLLTIEPGTGYAGALAVRAREVTVQTWDWRVEEATSLDAHRRVAMERGEA